MTEIAPVPAATVTLVRDGSHGLEVLMLQRNFRSGFMPGMYLFPGGALDPGDAAAELAALCAGLDDAEASRRLGLARGGLAYWLAAIRESFEEAGLLLAYERDGALVNLRDPARRARCSAFCARLNAGQAEFIELLRAEGLRPAVDRMTYFGHWITPVSAPRRYDTRFFVALAPAEQEPAHDNVEAIAHLWIRPAQALERHAAGDFGMRFPTVRTLQQFAAYDTTASLIAGLRAAGAVPAWLPRIGRDGARLLPGDPGYEEAAAPEAGRQWRI
jgi:8-oxo-dGTP pyrophosphatase MutT (NUDIX family)